MVLPVIVKRSNHSNRACVALALTCVALIVCAFVPALVSPSAQRRKPQRPLCAECLEIVLKATPVNITYVDVTGGHAEHPHLGALDEHGAPGYVHDETALRKNPPLLQLSDTMLRSHCQKRDGNYRMLTEKVFVDLDQSKKKLTLARQRQRDSIFCLVYTIDTFHAKIPAIRETWG
jgi:hypothetical protein